MALLVEGISVIVRIDRIDETYPGGREGFEDDCPNQTLAADGDHASVWFMNPADVESFCKHLEDCGLVFQREGKAIDFAVVDQLQGLTVDCDWFTKKSKSSFSNSEGLFPVSFKSSSNNGASFLSKFFSRVA